MEGMTTRLPMGAARELAMVTVFMLPWTILFCSGFHDLSTAAKHEWIFWSGTVLVLGLLYFLNGYTTDPNLAKAAMPVLACASATVPHFFRRLSFIYSTLCVLFGLCGVIVFCWDTKTFMTGSSFATPVITALLVIFPIASITAGALLIDSFFRRSQQKTLSLPG